MTINAVSFRNRAKFIGGIGPVQKAMGRTFFIALKHGADTFLLQSPAMGRIHFLHYLETKEKIFTEKKNAVAAIFFTEVADDH